MDPLGNEHLGGILRLVHGHTMRDAILMNQQLKVENKTKKRICSEVSVNSPGIHVVSPEIEKEGYGGKDLQKRKVLSLE